MDCRIVWPALGHFREFLVRLDQDPGGEKSDEQGQAGHQRTKRRGSNESTLVLK